MLVDQIIDFASDLAIPNAIEGLAGLWRPLSLCLGLLDNGQYKSTNRVLVLQVVSREKLYGIKEVVVYLHVVA